MAVSFVWNRLVAIGNELKDLGDYASANALVDFLFKSWTPDRAELVWEVSEEEVGNSYYDLLALEVSDGGYLCIPLPLLSAKTFDLLRHATRVPRKIHDRQTKEENPRSRQELRDEAEKVAGETIFTAEAIMKGDSFLQEIPKDLQIVICWGEADACNGDTAACMGVELEDGTKGVGMCVSHHSRFHGFAECDQANQICEAVGGKRFSCTLLA